MRATVLARDGHRCRWPGCTVRAGLEVHHLIPIDVAPELAEDLANQVTLCGPHHLEAARQYRAAHPTKEDRHA